MGEDVIGGRGPSWQAMASVRISIVPPGPRLPPADMPDISTAATKPEVTASIHDFCRVPGAILYRLATRQFFVHIRATGKFDN
jgi:hypothetical protein